MEELFPPEQQIFGLDFHKIQKRIDEFVILFFSCVIILQMLFRLFFNAILCWEWYILFFFRKVKVTEKGWNFCIL